MTEEEWLNANNLTVMLEWLRKTRKLSNRKLRLFACACVRHVWHLLDDERSRQAVEIAERYADGWKSDADLLVAAADAGLAEPPQGSAKDEFRFAARAARVAAQARHARFGESVFREQARIARGHHPIPIEVVALDNATAAATLAFAAQGEADADHDWVKALFQCRELVLEVFGNPFRSATLAPSCLTSTVLALAQAAYNDRLPPSGHLDPAHLGVLADALEEAGCTDALLLEHLRGPGLHVRGCHVLDLILGKE